MADLGESLRALLLDDASVLASVQSRVIPDRLAQGETLPAIVYRVIDTTHYHDITGPNAGMARSRVTLECFASTRAGANSLAELVRNSGVRDWSGSSYGVDVRSVEIDSGMYYQTEEPNDGNHEYRYVASIDYAFHYTESV